jgi:radical SAM protein with 4Fe4S-binding SPASM domain
MTNKTIINKGNYSFETKEREKKFHQYKGEGWEKEYKEYRESWEKFPKAKYISDYPLLVDIELASVCNLKCPMCYTITADFKKKVNAKLMDFELYKKIIDEIAGNVSAIRLSLRGESTLHKKFIECIAYAKSKGIKEISFLTNGSTLDREMFIKIMNAGATWITISFDGLGENYNIARNPMKYEETLDKLKEIKKIKAEFGVNLPVIKTQGVWDYIREDPELYYKILAPYVDLLAFNPYIDFTKNPAEKIFINDFYCPQLYQSLVIGADGLTMMCSNDEENMHPIGDMNDSTVHQIWHSDQLNAVRDLHKKSQGYQQLEVCRHCYLPVETENNEKVSVNGREIVIQNYCYKDEI